MRRKTSSLAERFIRQERKRNIWKKVVLCLAGAVVLCTAYALILPGITMEDNPKFPALEDDSARVSGIEITEYVTGTAPFDSEEKPGNDRTANDKIVRTFDDITYHFIVRMEAYGAGQQYSEARVKLEFVLPLSEKEAVFDQSAMAWMDDKEDYKPELTVETRNVNGTDVKCQVLTCYKHLLPAENNLSVIPGGFGENVTIKVLSMKHGDTVTPIFSASMEYGAWEGPCQTHPEKREKWTVKAEPVTVTAAPKYNVQLALTPAYQTTVDFSQGNELAANKDLSPESGYKMTGRMNCLSVTLQLYNDDANKGLKGIEMPQGDITFQIWMTADYYVTEDGERKGIAVTEEYTPLLWSYGGNAIGDEQEDGRSVRGMSGLNYAVGAPYNTGGGSDGCYNGGNWRAEQKGNRLSITVSDYEIDPNSFPESNTAYVDNKYAANVGCFSAGEFWILQPFNKVNSAANTEYDKEKGYDIQRQHGRTGTISVYVGDDSMSAVSVSGQVFKDTPGVNDTQMNQKDDYCQESNFLTAPGILSNRIFYSFYGNIWNTSGTTWEVGLGSSGEARISAERFIDGKDAIFAGEELSLVSGFYHLANNEESNRTVCATTLVKFDASAITLIESSAASADYPIAYARTAGNVKDTYGFDCTTRYATKKDGQNWVDDSELLEAEEADLIFYDRVEEIPEGDKCVAALFLYTAGEESSYMSKTIDTELVYSSLTARVNKEESLLGNVYMLTEITRLWDKKDYDNSQKAYQEKPYDWTGKNIDPDAGIAGSVERQAYTKESYFPTGGARGTHTGGYSWGDSLLITGYETRITKNLAQTINGTQEKSTYNLDADQRVVDFVLKPGFQSVAGAYEQTTTIYIEDTLSKYMKYRPGSSYFGGSYGMSSENGGTQGIITDGTQISPYRVDDNGDGTQTLIWRIENVKIGQEMPVIYYSASVGSKGNESEDVPRNTTPLMNRVRIWGDEDLREPTKENHNYAEAGLSVVRSEAASFGKYVRQEVVEPDGYIDYVIYYDNNASTPRDEIAMVDTMPYNGDQKGSRYDGTYTVSSWSIDPARCDTKELIVYYTYDQKYRDKIKDQIEVAEIRTWNVAEVDDNGIVTAMNGTAPVAWAVVGRLDGNRSVRIEMQIKLEPGNAGQESLISGRYINILSNKNTTTTTEAHSVRRTLEGLAWLDKNYNGIQDKDELTDQGLLSGVKVSLWKLKIDGDPAKENDYEPYRYQGDSSKDIVEIETGQTISVRASGGQAAAEYRDEQGSIKKGRYKFTDLPAGTFAVKFMDKAGMQIIAPLIASPVKQGADDTSDSDGVPVYSEDRSKLQRTVILGIVMPEAKDMHVVLYESKYHDSGFYERGVELPQTGGTSTLPYTFSGIAIMGGALLYYRKRRRKGEKQS